MNLQTLERLRGPAPGCPSDLDLDHLAAGELPPDKAATLSAHVEGCAECSARLQEYRSSFAAFPQVDPRPLLAGIRRRLAEDEAGSAKRSFWRRFAVVSAPLAMAAAVALFVLARPPGSPIEPLPGDGVREKGALSLHVHRQAGSDSHVTASGDVFHAGDRLRFVVDLPRAGHVNVLGVEASGALYVAWPIGQGESTQLSAGKGQTLPGAVVLDESVGRETIYLVQCATASPATACHSAGAGAPPVCPADCALTPFVLDKRAAPPAR